MSSQTGPGQRNVLSFDVEHWHEAALLRDAVGNPTDHVEQSLAIVLDLLDRHGVTATFFVVGTLAEQYPELVARIRRGGHELGSHGYVHDSVTEFTPDRFRLDLERSAAAIEDATGIRPRGFRAPNFSIGPDNAWALGALAESEYTYDSSIFPMWTPMYGVASGPNHPYVVRPDRPFTATPVLNIPADVDDQLVEVPLAVAGRRLRVPIAGGFYARALPLSVTEWGIRWLNERGIPATLYFHPWEFNPAVKTTAPRIDRRLVSFHGIETLERKLDRLLERFAFGPVSGVLADEKLQSPPEIGATEVADDQRGASNGESTGRRGERETVPAQNGDSTAGQEMHGAR